MPRCFRRSCGLHVQGDWICLRWMLQYVLTQFGWFVHRFNICKGNLPETKQLCQTILEEIFVPALKKPADGFEQMSRSLLEGMWAMVPFVDYDAFMAFTMRLAGIEVTEDKSKTLPFTSKVLLAYQIFVHEVVLMNRFLAFLVRPALNFLMWFSVFMTQRLPILAYVQFGRSHVYWLAPKHARQQIRRAIRPRVPRNEFYRELDE